VWEIVQDKTESPTSINVQHSSISDTVCTATGIFLRTHDLTEQLYMLTDLLHNLNWYTTLIRVRNDVILVSRFVILYSSRQQVKLQYRSHIHILMTNKTHDMQRGRINSSVDCTPAIVWLEWHLARSNKIAHADVSKQRFSLLTNTWPDSMLFYWGVPTARLLEFKMNLSDNIYLLLFIMIVCSEFFFSNLRQWSAQRTNFSMFCRIPFRHVTFINVKSISISIYIKELCVPLFNW
jgi:hypothetical protein